MIAHAVEAKADEASPARERWIRAVERFGVPDHKAREVIHTLSDDDILTGLFEGTRGHRDDSAPLSTEAPAIKRLGLGYQATYPASGVRLSLTSIRESRGELSGLLTVTMGSGPRSFAGGQIYAGRFAVSSVSARMATAKYLDGRVKGDWTGILEAFCIHVLAEQHQTARTVVIGRNPPRERLNYMLSPILPLGKPTILFGPGGTNKSTLANAVAVSVTSGRVIVPGWEPTRGGVLVLDWEDDCDEWNDRTWRIASGAGIPAPEIHYRAMSRTLADDLEAIAAEIDEKGVLLVIVDSVFHAAGGSGDGENWSSAAARLFEALRQLPAGTTSLLIDHVAGANIDTEAPASKPFGSVVKINSARSVFELRAERQSTEDGRTELLMLHTKSNGPRVPSRGLAVIRDEHTIRFERTDVEAPDLVHRLPVHQRMERVLRSGPQPCKSLAEAVGAEEATVRAAFSRDQKGAKRFVKLPDHRYALGHRE